MFNLWEKFKTAQLKRLPRSDRRELLRAFPVQEAPPSALLGGHSGLANAAQCIYPGTMVPWANAAQAQQMNTAFLASLIDER